MPASIDFLDTELEAREKNNSLRTLRSESNLIDFCSNDYLGLARSQELFDDIQQEVRGLNKNGSTGSRLISGHTDFTAELEDFISSYHNAEDALIFNSGYNANLGLLSSLAKRTDTIIYDEFIHASLRDGIRLSPAKAYKFKHNEIDELSDLIKKATGNVFVVVESVYSMDGDFAPLREFVELKNQYEFKLIVDEAHAVGIFGTKGEGRVCELGLESSVFARTVTYGKAMGCHGAAVLGSSSLKQYLINFSRPFIYTTALPVYNLVAIQKSYSFLSHKNHKINDLVSLFKEKVDYYSISGFTSSSSPIQALIVPGNENVKNVSSSLKRKSFDVRPILSPTVREGTERLRICIHTFNTEKEICDLLSEIAKML